MGKLQQKIKDKKMGAEIGQALFSDTERFEMWFAAYWKPTAAAALGVAIVIAIVFGIRSASEAADKKAAFALADAVTEQELVDALNKYPSHAGSAMARYRLAKVLIDSEKNEPALKELDAVASADGVDATLAANARLAAAYVCETSGKMDDAIRRFAEVEAAAVYPAAQRAEAGYSAGRLLIKAGKDKEAAAILAKVAMMNDGSPLIGYWAESAKNTQVALESGEYKAPAAKPAKKK